jgi:hypothetical protein
MKIEIQYAPVVITTLNRFDHFKACLESLEKCTWAENTDVYVALDYPPSDKYRAGWLKLCKYLEKKEAYNLFKKMIVVKRDRNYGIRPPNNNSRSIIFDLQHKYDRYIFSEDDNIFSPNFLVYINKGLEKFKDDDRISFVCGYNYPMEFPESYTNNFYISKHISPWGYGTWFSKQEAIKKYYDLDFLKEILRDKESFKKLMKYKTSTVYSIINMLKNNTVYGDSASGSYLCLEDKYCIFPTISKVKNIGDDGSGVNAKSKYDKQTNYYLTQLVDKEHKFEFSDDIFTYEPEILNRYSSPKLIIKEFYKGLIGRIDLFLFRHFNFVPKSKYI